MNDDYRTLGLPPSADDAAIRQRYLELVRQFPPDRQPLRAAEIRAAYDRLRDPVRRTETQVFKPFGNELLIDIVRDVRQHVRCQRIPVETLLSLMQH